ncbi:hypothetical protein IFM89_036136 [Coptis chinensis]|uniref:Fe2OG dioxygenase domain-containing protein n=1 Tax=Coptis chinensis TaxID=261450 RepID=A0A835HPR0_9MAGN|nr:hypothetical protein IFM89_036136 [Coptis chinensis]
MCSVSSEKLPVIDFSGLDCTRSGTTSWCSVRTKVRQALGAYGCFEAIFDEIKFHGEMLSALEELFGLPSETKAKYTAKNHFEGFGSNPHMLYESMGIDDVLVRERLQRVTDILWPEGNSGFCQTTFSFISKLSKMEEMVKRMVFESFGVKYHFEPLGESTSYLLRLMKYRPPTINESNIGIVTHTDTSFFTILGQNHINGLEIQGNNGEWITVIPSASSFIVMIGDACMAWSNGRLHCPPHRVTISTGDDVRYSVGLFSFNKGVIQTPEEMVDDEHPLLFKPFDHMGFRLFFCTKEGQMAKSAIKSYCGI